MIHAETCLWHHFAGRDFWRLSLPVNEAGELI